MHIPDGFLSAPVWIGTTVVSATAVGVAVRGANRELDDVRVPLMGVMGAFVFAAQMINFPIPFGTSGHLTGAVLLMVLLGSRPALLAMACILIVQCLLFADGGLSSLGANILNMAVIPVSIGSFMYRGLRPSLGWRAAAGLTAWTTVVISAAAASLEGAVSGTWPLRQSLLLMCGAHFVIGAVEGAITMAVLSFITRVRHDLLPQTGSGDKTQE